MWADAGKFARRDPTGCPRVGRSIIARGEADDAEHTVGRTLRNLIWTRNRNRFMKPARAGDVRDSVSGIYIQDRTRLGFAPSVSDRRRVAAKYRLLFEGRSAPPRSLDRLPCGRFNFGSPFPPDCNVIDNRTRRRRCPSSIISAYRLRPVSANPNGNRRAIFKNAVVDTTRRPTLGSPVTGPKSARV